MKNFISKGIVGGLVLTVLLLSTAFSSTAFASPDNKGLEKEVDGIKVNLIFMNEDIKIWKQRLKD